MADDNNSEEQGQRPGSMRFQDPRSATPQEPSLAEQRARQQAMEQERQRQAAAAQAAQEAERKADTRRKMLIGSGVTVGLVGLVASWYLVAKPDEVTAKCTNEDGVIVENENYCDEDYVERQGGHVGPSGFMFMPLPGGGFQQYRYNYGGHGDVGSKVQGGSFERPKNANIKTPSGKNVQRGGFGPGGRSSGFGKGGGS